MIINRIAIRYFLFIVGIVPLLSSMAQARLATSDVSMGNFTDALDYFDAVFKQPEFIYSRGTYDSMARTLYGEGLGSFYYPPAILDKEAVLTTLHATLMLYKKRLEPISSWIKQDKPGFECPADGRPITGNGYIHKVMLPPGAEIIFFGDLHGSIHALGRVLTRLMAEGYLDANLRLIKRDAYIIFLGDFVDYGRYGVDTLCAALTLRTRNPEQVFLCRGNHEDMRLNQTRGRFDFITEVESRYGDSKANGWQVLSTIYDLYERLPYALFLGIEGHEEAGYAQCCHGGIEEGASDTIRALFKDKKARFARLPQSAYPADYQYSNFNWGDFTGVGTKNRIPSHRLTCGGWCYTIPGAQQFMKTHNIRAIFRGHQDMENMFRLLIRGIHDPMYIFSSRPAHRALLGTINENNQWVPHKVINRFPCSQAQLMNSGFLLGALPINEQGDWDIAPIFTFTNASATRATADEGCGIFKLAATWEEGRLRLLRLSDSMMQQRYRLHEQHEIPATLQLSQRAYEKSIVRIDDLKVPYQAFVFTSFLPFMTCIDEVGNIRRFATLKLDDKRWNYKASLETKRGASIARQVEELVHYLAEDNKPGLAAEFKDKIRNRYSGSGCCDYEPSGDPDR